MCVISVDELVANGLLSRSKRITDALVEAQEMESIRNIYILSVCLFVRPSVRLSVSQSLSSKIPVLAFTMVKVSLFIGGVVFVVLFS